MNPTCCHPNIWETPSIYTCIFELPVVFSGFLRRFFHGRPKTAKLPGRGFSFNVDDHLGGTKIWIPKQKHRAQLIVNEGVTTSLIIFTWSMSKNLSSISSRNDPHIHFNPRILDIPMVPQLHPIFEQASLKIAGATATRPTKDKNHTNRPFQMLGLEYLTYIFTINLRQR